MTIGAQQTNVRDVVVEVVTVNVIDFDRNLLSFPRCSKTFFTPLSSFFDQSFATVIVAIQFIPLLVHEESRGSTIAITTDPIPLFDRIPTTTALWIFFVPFWRELIVELHRTAARAELLVRCLSATLKTISHGDM